MKHKILMIFDEEIKYLESHLKDMVDEVAIEKINSWLHQTKHMKRRFINELIPNTVKSRKRVT